MVIRKKKSYFGDIIKKFLPLIMKAMKLEYSMGSLITIEGAKQQGVKNVGSVLELSKKDEKALTDTMETLMKDVDSELSKKFLTAINENITERGSNKELAERIDNIFDKTKPEYFNYKNRNETIARTESTRALNLGIFNKGKRLGAKKKYLTGVPDNRQGDDSKVVIAKYDSPEKAIPIDENFKFTFGKKNFDYLMPPNRPNDRELVSFTFE